MSVEVLTGHDSSQFAGEFSCRGWQVPSFIVNFARTRQTKYCIVIPVINEGKRIQSLLSKMYEQGQDAVADIILVDGGSKDGSLDADKIKLERLGALLTKTGPGKLSSQLRCAYAYAALQGYEGIITIDGNDKDDPASMLSFVGKLDEGFDFVQASRFIAGGKAINTPLSRWWAIRLLHAPMLSIASGFKWTDTTQGYRAYSAKMLLDERVQPFRDVFLSYELLAYLSYRAPRLGFRCIEVPTTRIYPANEAVPTKIGGWRGNLSLVGTLWDVCTGKFNPGCE